MLKECEYIYCSGFVSICTARYRLKESAEEQKNNETYVVHKLL